jgi:hypothetical protein
MMLVACLHAEQAPRKPLAEGLVLPSVDGRLVRDDVNDVWRFDLIADVNMPGVQIPADTQFPLLPSAVLESMIGDSNDRAGPLYRLSVLVTRYGGENYLSPMYYLPLSRLTEPNEPQQQSGDQPAVTGTEPNIAFPIPSQIAEMLKNRRTLRAQQRLAPTSPSQATPAHMLVDVVGFIEQRGGRTVFVPDALGLDVSAKEYLLLPNAMLEQAQRLEAASPDRVRFGVAGMLNEFKGKQYLLLERATRVHNFGDFGG